jgi:hypothetical protein
MSSESEPQPPIELMSEFAWVRVTVDRSARGARLAVEDVESGTIAYFDALELSSMCHATAEQRHEWLRTGLHASQRPDSDGPL